jgi:hypothetical protein
MVEERTPAAEQPKSNQPTWSRDYKYSNENAGFWLYTIYISTDDTREMYVTASQKETGNVELAEGATFLPEATRWTPSNLESTVRQFNRSILAAFDKATAAGIERRFDPSKNLEKMGFQQVKEEE